MVSRAPKTQANRRLQPLQDINLRNREAEETDRLPFFLLAALRTPRNQRNKLWPYVGTNSP